MIKLREVKGLQHPQGFAHTVNGNKNGNYTKGGYGLTRNGAPVNQYGTNPFKTK